LKRATLGSEKVLSWVGRRFLPVTVEGEAGEDEEKADGRAPGILEEDADGERERTGDENARDEGIARATIGARMSGSVLRRRKRETTARP